MTHNFGSFRISADQMYFEHVQKLANVATAHAELVMGADKAKRFEAKIAKCINGKGDVAFRTDRLRDVYNGLLARINAHIDDEKRATRHLVQQLLAYMESARGPPGTMLVHSLTRCAVKRELDLTSLSDKLLEETNNFHEKDRTGYLEAMPKLAALADSTKAKLNTAKEASARFENVLRTANEKIAQLENEASATSDRVAEAVRDLQKLVYEKEDSDEDAPNCADCQALKAKLDDLDPTLVALVKENSKLLGDKKDLLEDRQRDKDEVKRVTEQMIKLRAENAAENPKKRNK